MSLVLSTLVWGWTPGAGRVAALVRAARLIGTGDGRPLRSRLARRHDRRHLWRAVDDAGLDPGRRVRVQAEWPTPVVGATAGMSLGALAAFWLCRLLPWMPAPGAWRTDWVDKVGPGIGEATSSRLWVLRRALADFSEAQFMGNEWASAAMILGAVVAYLVSSSNLVYGSGLFLAVLASQGVTAVAGVLIWRGRWQAHGFYPTFVPVVSVAPATVLALGGTLQSVVAGAARRSTRRSSGRCRDLQPLAEPLPPLHRLCGGDECLHRRDRAAPRLRTGNRLMTATTIVDAQADDQ